MASSYSTNLGIELIGNGEQDGTWGTTVNTNLGTLIEQAISGYTTYACTGGTDTITIPNGASGTARNMFIELTGTGGGTLVVPSNKKLYFIYNNTASGAVTVKVSGQTGVSVPNATKMVLVSDGTDIVIATNYMAALTLGSALPVASGGTGQTTANAAFNALAPSQASASGKYLKSDGTNTSWDAIDISTSDVTGTLALANGGTGSTTASGARTNLGLGTMATQAASAVAITGGDISGITDLAVADGGTGASTAADARTNLGVPSATGTGASGTWAIDISGSSATATSATSAATVTSTVASGATGTTQAYGTNNTTIATTAFVQAALAAVYPVGSIYCNASSSTNPATLLGFGTWTALAAGRVLLGAGGGYTAGDTGGSADAIVVSHTHSVTDPGHTHTTATRSAADGTSGSKTYMAGVAGSDSATDTTQSSSIASATTGISVASAGSSGTGANLPPYLVVYMWQRTA